VYQFFILSISLTIKLYKERISLSLKKKKKHVCVYRNLLKITETIFILIYIKLVTILVSIFLHIYFTV